MIFDPNKLKIDEKSYKNIKSCIPNAEQNEWIL